MTQTIRLTVNGEAHELSVEPRKTLLAVLRDQLGLTGTKEGCSTGDCGACTVIVDGRPLTSCLMLAVQADGREITTVEGLADKDHLHPVQQALLEKGGFQCGFCTPGFVVSTAALLDRKPNPSDDEIRRALAGNLCRCTGYTKIMEAVRQASQILRRRKPKKKAAA